MTKERIKIKKSNNMFRRKKIERVSMIFMIIPISEDTILFFYISSQFTLSPLT